MNRTKDLVVFTFFVILLSTIDNTMAQSFRPMKPSLAPKESSPQTGPKMLPSPTNPIKIEEVKIRVENPIWSPSGDKIAFIRVVDGLSVSDGNPNARGLYVIEAGNGIPRLISSVSLSPRNFCWSPDGKKIAFVEAEFNDYNIYIFDFATRARTKITNHKDHTNPISGYSYLAWSPDGTKLAFSAIDSRERDYNNGYELWIADAQGKFWFKLASGFNPVWFPDSKKIAFAVGTPDGQSLFFTINVDGKNPKEIKGQNDKAFLNLRDIYISSDSEYILFITPHSLNVMGLNESQPTTVIIFGDGSDESPIILGSNNKIIAVAKDDNVQIFDISKLISTSKNGIQTPTEAIISQLKIPNLTEQRGKLANINDPYRAFWSWSSDNKEIAFVGKDKEIWKISTSSTNQRQLTFERTKLAQRARQEQEKEQALAREKLESELNK